MGGIGSLLLPASSYNPCSSSVGREGIDFVQITPPRLPNVRTATLLDMLILLNDVTVRTDTAQKVKITKLLPQKLLCCFHEG